MEIILVFWVLASGYPSEYTGPGNRQVADHYTPKKVFFFPFLISFPFSLFNHYPLKDLLADCI